MLQDLLLLAELQKVNKSLCPIESLTHPRSPLWKALTSFLAFEEAQTFTFILNESRRDGKRLRGFIQVKQPATRPEMYIHCVAPQLDAAEDAHAAWNRLLNHVVAMAEKKGIHRIFACAAEGSTEREVLVGAGFSVYTREDIFCLAPDAHLQAVAGNGIRPEQSTDTWEIRRLYRAIAPYLVQRAETFAESKDGEWLSGPVSWNQGEGFVMEDREGIVGYGHLTPGHTGHWLTILVHPRAYDQVDPLLSYGLALLNYYPPYPVYCATREYQGGIRTPLSTRGFTLFSTQCCLVKHTTVCVQENARSLVPALEKRAKAPTTTASPSET
jgi:hypothetical protein